jgi:hypothetical protein
MSSTGSQQRDSKSMLLKDITMADHRYHAIDSVMGSVGEREGRSTREMRANDGEQER